MDVCVTAFGPSGTKFAATKADGRFVIGGLRPGTYDLQYRSCGGAEHYLTTWYGGSAERRGSQPVVVAGAGVHALAPITLQPAGEPFSLASGQIYSAKSLAAAMMSSSSSGHGSAAPTLRTAPVASARGRIAGVVTSTNGKGLQGICVEAVSIDGAYYRLATTSKTGHFRMLGLPADRYEVAFYAQCGNKGNWLIQIYHDNYGRKKPTLVHVRPGKTTASIDATMKLGGEISGVITNATGNRLSDICVYPLGQSNHHALVYDAVSTRGTYHLRGMPAGTYRIAFLPCGSSVYAPTWLGGTGNEAASRLVRVKGVQHVQHVNQVMPVGAVLTGTVTGATSPTPTPLGGICVFVQDTQGAFANGQLVTTNNKGKYSVKGLPTGSYQVQFQLGCPNNGNYVGTNYPGLVKVFDGKTRSGINGALPVGAIISGTVTSHATGHALGGICVVISEGATGQYGYEDQTYSDGSYAFNQLPAGRYTVQFSGGCGDHGNYAPQAFDSTNPATPTIFSLNAGQTEAADAAMNPGAVIVGTVTSNTGKPLSGICAVALSTEGYLISIGTTDSAGHYHAGSLAPGLYDVFFATGCGNKENLTSQVFGAQANGQGPAAVSVTAGTTKGINGVLAQAGTISGVLKTKSGKLVRGGCVNVTGETAAASLTGAGGSNGGGKYRVGGLSAGLYLVEFEAGCSGDSYENQWYSGKASPAGARLVRVRAGHTTAGIDSAVVPGGSIEGQITSRGKPVRNVCVYAQSVTQLSDFGFGVSGKDGKYVMHGLNSGRYELQLTPCFGSARLANVVLTRLVSVKAPRTTGGVDASVPVAGTISGAVLGGTPALPQYGTCIFAFGLSTGYAVTGPDGTFQLTNLAPGRYLIYFGEAGCALTPQALAPQWYDNQPTQRTAMSVKVTAGADTKIVTATLASDGAISGNVTGAGNSPLSGACVAAYATGQGMSPVYTVTAANGSYSIAYLTPGSYKVEFTAGCGATGYRAQWWHNAASVGKAKTVTVASGATTPGVDAAMTK